MPPQLAARIVSDVCGGLHAAHSHRRDDGAPAPILHRDVSPHNVMLGLDGAVKLADFGVAKAADTVSNTESGVLKGKLVYIAPEQVNGAPPEPRMDLYAAGLMLYVCLTGFHPFQKKSDLESMSAILRGARPAVTELRPDVPREIAALVDRALAPAIADRFQTAEEMQLALERALAQIPGPSSNADLGRWLRQLLGSTRDAQLNFTRASSAPLSAAAAATQVMTPGRNARLHVNAPAVSDAPRAPAAAPASSAGLNTVPITGSGADAKPTPSGGRSDEQGSVLNYLDEE